jgi:Alpha-L-arabinofuranosidase B (ABFB) domain
LRRTRRSFSCRGWLIRNGISFESFNFRGRYLRHRDFHLFVDPEDSANLAPDATFFKEFASVPIDPGTILVPADN